MIVSALLTAVGINLGLCILFFTLYSVLKKQPENIRVYAPRLIAEQKLQKRRLFDIERLLPSTSWVRRAWDPSEEEMLSKSGLDAVVFMRIFIFSLRLFSVTGIVGICILLPINYLGNQLSDIDFSDLPSKSLDVFSISNVKDGSKWLWVHFCSAYLISGFVCFLLYYEYENISSKRISYFYSSKPQPHQFAILVRGIPLCAGSSFNDSVESFFMEYHSSTYLSHWVVRRTNKLQRLIDIYEFTNHVYNIRGTWMFCSMKDAEKLHKRLTHLKSSARTSQNVRRNGFLGLFGQKVDIVEHYEKKLEELEENLRIEQSDASLTDKEATAAFVCFKSRYGTAVALHIQQSINPTHWVTEEAPEADDVYWPFFSDTFMRRWISKLVVIVATIILTILFLIPVVFVQGLANLKVLQRVLPFLKSILTIAFVSQVITGYLPSLILQMFLLIVPPIMEFLSSIEGYVSHSQIELSACNKVLWFTIWNIFFANVLSGSVFDQLDVFLEPKNIPLRLAVAVPAQASFFIAYVVTSGWTSMASELARVVALLSDFIGRHCSSKTNDEFHVPTIPYHSDIPKILFFGLLGITYFLLAPLILPFLLGFYCLGYIVYRNQLLNVYAPRFETGGKFWPIVHNATIFSLILMQAIALGIFGLKKLPLASSLIVPLPILTLLFNYYCRKRFLPIFKSYSAESLIKKDREDQNDPTMAEFFEKLKNAYRDPALLPIQFSGYDDRRSSPLLRGADV